MVKVVEVCVPKAAFYSAALLILVYSKNNMQASLRIQRGLVPELLLPQGRQNPQMLKPITENGI
jgi:hypothetical protein